MKLVDAAVSPGVAQRVTQGSGQAQSSERPTDVKDKVSVSTPTPRATDAETRAAVEAARSAVAGSRADRVEEIVNAVRSGQYYPSPKQIAQKLVSEAEVEARLRALLAK